MAGVYLFLLLSNLITNNTLINQNAFFAVMNYEMLKKFGLTNTEIKIYITLLKIGQNLASKISHSANVERAVTYHTLEKLIRKGLVSYYIKENRKYFTAADPEKLRDLLREKEDALTDILPHLAQLKHQNEQPLAIEVFRGVEGFKTVLEDIIREKQSYYIIGYTGLAPTIASFWYLHWQKRRIKCKVMRYVLAYTGFEHTPALDYALTHIRVLPKKIISEPKTSTIIYGKDKVLLFLPLAEFTGIRIKNREVHQSYQEYFDVLWKQSTSYPRR